jgi:hypothetical protein
VIGVAVGDPVTGADVNTHTTLQLVGAASVTSAN